MNKNLPVFFKKIHKILNFLTFPVSLEVSGEAVFLPGSLKEERERAGQFPRFLSLGEANWAVFSTDAGGEIKIVGDDDKGDAFFLLHF